MAITQRSGAKALRIIAELDFGDFLSKSNIWIRLNRYFLVYEKDAGEYPVEET